MKLVNRQTLDPDPQTKLGGREGERTAMLETKYKEALYIGVLRARSLLSDLGANATLQTPRRRLEMQRQQKIIEQDKYSGPGLVR